MKNKNSLKRFKAFVLGIFAGMSVALGGSVFLSVENKVTGSVLFTVGLFAVCTFGFYLFTGKICYVFDKDRDYLADIPFIWLGNFAGAAFTAFLESLTRVGPALYERASALAAVKLSDSLLSIFILSIFCNIMIFIGVDGYNNNPHELGKYLALFFGIVTFILCGFEHCVANMYYITMAGAWSGRALVFLLVNTLGNACGGVLIPLVRNGLQKLNY